MNQTKRVAAQLLAGCAVAHVRFLQTGATARRAIRAGKYHATRSFAQQKITNRSVQ
jgi:hypothetical protein